MGYNVAMLFIVIEHYTDGPEPVYQRAAERGRMLPNGLHYVDSWIVDDGGLAPAPAPAVSAPFTANNPAVS
ncbi:MAG TPA: DUF3303 family protein [Streptosporangiaceae bacterium]|jgi:hypothetical protein